MIRKYFILTLVAFMGTGHIFGYTHEEFKQDSLKLLNLEMQEKAGVKVDTWFFKEEICNQWATIPDQTLNEIIKANERKVFDFLQETLTFENEEAAKEDLWELFMQAVNAPEIGFNSNPIAVAWMNEKMNKPTANLQKFAYSHEVEARKLDNKVISELAKLLSGLEKSQKDLFKAFVLKSKKDLYFGRIEEVAITTGLLQSHRRADMIDALNDQQLAYLIFNFYLEGAPSTVDSLVELMRSSL
jgi:hypothetical protein